MSLNFDDLKPIEIPVRVGGKDYLLVEASADAARQYRNATLRGARWDGESRTSTPGQVADAEPLLVSLCLFELVEGRRRPVPLATVLTWPNRVVAPLFEQAKKISGLTDRPSEQEEAEADPTGNGVRVWSIPTTPTSASPAN